MVTMTNEFDREIAADRRATRFEDEEELQRIDAELSKLTLRLQKAMVGTMPSSSPTLLGLLNTIMELTVAGAGFAARLRQAADIEKEARWKKQADAREYFQAVRTCRDVHGCGLLEAKAMVEGYVGKSIRLT